MPIDLAPLWDFSHPEISEQRFRAALTGASRDDALILLTQIARTYGLRRDFARGRQLLESIAPQVRDAGPEARARFALELGRTYASAAHPPESQTAEAVARARAEYQSALEIARGAQLDGLAIDAIHMMAFVDTAPADQLRWAEAALVVVTASSQPAAKAWEASIRNNLGYAQHQLGRYDDALAEFQTALALRQRQGDGGRIRTAEWMIAWTLRALHCDAEALELQLRLERESDAAGAPDPYVFEELETLYRAAGNESLARHYAGRKQALAQ
jgi:hypothetical protein